MSTVSSMYVYNINYFIRFIDILFCDNIKNLKLNGISNYLVQYNP